MTLRGYFWSVVNGIQSSPLLPKQARKQLLRLAGVSMGKGSYVGERVYLGSAKLSLCDHAGIAPGSFIDGSANVTLGEWVRLGPCVRILTSSHLYRKSVIRRGPPDPAYDTYKPVTIERGCWIGMGATILLGVTIREGCVVAAGAVVTSSTEPNGLYAGIPAKRIKDLPLDDDNKD